jgi:hypothetical protein
MYHVITTGAGKNKKIQILSSGPWKKDYAELVAQHEIKNPRNIGIYIFHKAENKFVPIKNDHRLEPRHFQSIANQMS